MNRFAMPVTLTLPLPPSKNRLRGSGRARVFPTAAYKRWLGEASVLLWLQLRAGGPWEPDAAHYWAITAVVWLGARQQLADAHNLEEAIFDLLEGAQVDRRSGRIVKPGALYTNDRRVATHTWTLGGWDHARPRIELDVRTTDAPVRWHVR